MLCLFLCALCVGTCSCASVCACVLGMCACMWSTQDNLSCYSGTADLCFVLFCFLKSLTGQNSPSRPDKLASKSRVLLSPTPQQWDYKHVPQCLAFFSWSGDQTWVLLLTRQHFPFSCSYLTRHTQLQSRKSCFCLHTFSYKSSLREKSNPI